MDISTFLAAHQLPDSYRDIALKWFTPLADEIFAHQESAKKPVFIGVNGCQGSGKSTLCDFLVYYLSQHKKLNIVSLSLDDFYLDKSSRNALAVKVHPLLATRGVPGTHDVELAQQTFDRLRGYGTVSIPRFNKAIDDPYPVVDWPVIHSPPDVVLVEGWCWGVSSQSKSQLLEPVNILERDEDPLGIWRSYVNKQLGESYQALFDQMSFWIMLKAPSFAQVYNWRKEQEHKLAAKVGASKPHTGIMTDLEIERFIQHYQRLTEHSLETLPARCNYVFHLDETRQITKVDKAV
ncbi:kinase [Alteromonas lipolytica]|uniref:Kinase n=1 Tax=Alteromonas lipolytica TaxID=1856405 RepID=A0A1E8FH67_9ALTE|nr:kinase [Alteromonas lipolytica]OFI35297.1 kinase [Alteromonas lipolytica]GGF58377.1 kinase [Alteromonas lipolytica]